MQGLVAVHLGYADDASIPTFAPLISDTDLCKPPGKEDELIDQLIETLDISEFHPENGPMNPATIKLRDEVTNKVLRSEGKHGYNIVQTQYNTIDIMFRSFEEVSEDLIDKLKDAFPLCQKKTPNDARPSGQKIFRKRHGSADFEADDEKKLKLDDDFTEEPVEALVQQDEDELVIPEALPSVQPVLVKHSFFLFCFSLKISKPKGMHPYHGHPYTLSLNFFHTVYFLKLRYYITFESHATSKYS